MPPLPTAPSKSPLKELGAQKLTQPSPKIIQNNIALNGSQQNLKNIKTPSINGTQTKLKNIQNSTSNGTQEAQRLNGTLPPLAPNAKRFTTLKKSHTTNLDEKIEQASQKNMFQARPLKSVQTLNSNARNVTQNGVRKSRFENETDLGKISDGMQSEVEKIKNRLQGLRSSSIGPIGLKNDYAQNNIKKNPNVIANTKNLSTNGYSKTQASGDFNKFSAGVENDMQELKNRLQNIRSSSVGPKDDPKKPENGFINHLRLYRGSKTSPKLSEDTISENNQNFQEFRRRLGIRSSSLGPRGDFLATRTIPEDTISEGNVFRTPRRPRSGERTSRMIEKDMNNQIRKLQGIRSASVGATLARINQGLPKTQNKTENLPKSGNIRSSSVGSLNGYPNLRARSLGPCYGSNTSLNTISRSISPCSSIISESSTAPRRIFPQIGASVGDLSELDQKEQSPVVFDANLSFVIGCKSQVRENIKPMAAHLDKDTASNLLAAKISDFLKRTDHVMDEWREMGHKEDDRTWTGNTSLNAEERRVLHRSRSATNIMLKGYQYFSRASSVARSNSVTREMRDMSEDRFTDMTDFDELSEMTADIAEEHSTSTLATERLDAETQERVRLERELAELQNKNRNLQQSSERLEMELLYARSDLNGLNSEEEDENDEGVYKQRYERVARELEFTRRRLQQQHEDDLEQLVGLKKQLEKKLSDAYEEVEEQRQVVGQWKRKVQKLNAETNDLRMLLEEQNSRNHQLEKKQRKHDSESGLLHDELRQEKQYKERLAREKEIVLAEKFTVENNLADLRLELDMKEEKINSLQRELDELTFGGKTEEEVTLLRKQKMELDRRLHEQEEELDELAGQTQLLEQAKLRLEMSLEQIRKEAKREAQQREEELEEVRCNAQKKVKALESQLENEHEERTLLLREKHELDRRLTTLTESQRGDRAQEEAQMIRLRRDLKRTKALLRDAQTMIERYRADGTSRAVLRQLRNQLEDAECARSNAVKAKQVVEGELSEVQAQLEEAQRQRSEADDRFNSANRERGELRTQLEENEEELAEVLKKYRSAVQQASVDQLALQEQVSLVSDLESERNCLRERLAELTTKLESLESLGDPSSNLMAKRMELKCKELESKLELEQTTRSRLEVQIARLKETVDKLQSELVSSRTKEQGSQDTIRKLQRNIRELRDENIATAARESECLQKRKELEKKVEASEAETSAAKADLKLAMKRIDDLQSAIQGELEDTLSDHSESEQDSYSSDESIETFLANHKLAPTKSRSSIKLDSASPV